MSEKRRKTKRKPALRMNFRPSYWSESDPTKLLLNSVQGQLRRGFVKEALENPGEPLPPELVTAPKLDTELRQVIAGIHPALMGGEYLPDMQDDEVEIARVVLDSVMCDVTSVRAHRLPSGRIGYRVVDEYAEYEDEEEGEGEADGDSESEERKEKWPFVLPFTESDQPLTLAELVEFMSKTRKLGDAYEQGLLERHWNWHYHEGGLEAEAAVEFAGAESDFYPQLGDYYERLGARQRREWIREERDSNGGKRRPEGGYFGW